MGDTMHTWNLALILFLLGAWNVMNILESTPRKLKIVQFCDFGVKLHIGKLQIPLTTYGRSIPGHKDFRVLKQWITNYWFNSKPFNLQMTIYQRFCLLMYCSTERKRRWGVKGWGDSKSRPWTPSSRMKSKVQPNHDGYNSQAGDFGMDVK